MNRSKVLTGRASEAEVQELLAMIREVIEERMWAGAEIMVQQHDVEFMAIDIAARLRNDTREDVLRAWRSGA